MAREKPSHYRFALYHWLWRWFIESDDGAIERDAADTHCYEPGNCVSLPTVIPEVKPTYTLEAARARIKATVRVPAVVLSDGTVSDVTILRSLDPTFGLARRQ